MNPQTLLSALRRKLTLRFALMASLAALFGVVIISGAAQSTKEEREFKNSIPDHVPIKVKVKNPEKTKDLKNDKWLDELEIEVKNTGDKPFYFLYLVLDLPEAKDADGVNVAFQLRYGRSQLVDFATPIQPDDAPIRPGESFIFRVPENNVEGWKTFKAEREISGPKKVEIRFQLINFGDGTGFVGTTAEPQPNPNKRSGQAPCTDESKKNVISTNSNAPPINSLDSRFQLSILITRSRGGRTSTATASNTGRRSGIYAAISLAAGRGTCSS